VSDRVRVLDTPTPERYPCSVAGCDRTSARVYIVEFTNGDRPGVAFYGYCRTYANRGKRIAPLRQPTLGCTTVHECGCRPPGRSKRPDPE
jgi:hypothetical protein